ncbi:MAG: hypothetical protein ABJF11_00470 [Reichenbachiella sp.]|uniref:hypothetical protein n=1 Tax=Reichenbachiella sp. TaxID=2184521 RepID=UPI003263CE24
MKKLSEIGLTVAHLSAAFLLSNCAVFVTFEEPQPFFKKSETHFSKKFQGSYVNPLDPRILTITDSAILISSDWNIEVTPNASSPIFEVNSNRDNPALVPDQDMQRDKRIANKTWNRIDTIFSLSDHHILRQFKKDYFLNYRELDNYWYLEFMTLDKNDKLLISAMFIDDLIALEQEMPLKKMLNSNGEVIKVVLKPNKKQFKKLIRREDYRLTIFKAERINSN